MLGSVPLDIVVMVWSYNSIILFIWKYKWLYEWKRGCCCPCCARAALQITYI